MRNVFGLILGLVCLLVFSNTGFAQNCKNGKCQMQGTVIVPQAFIVPQGFSFGPNCPCEKGQCQGPSCSKGGCTSGSCDSFSSKSSFKSSSGQRRGLLARIRGK